VTKALAHSETAFGGGGLIRRVCDSGKSLGPCSGPTGERKTLVPDAAKGHAFKGTYGSDSDELKTDVCCSNGSGGKVHWFGRR
jgi:hypothetical protein